MNTKAINIIVNPLSAGGKTGINISEILKQTVCLMEDDPEVFITKSSKEAESIVKDQINKGVENFIAVGGDGTLNSVVNGFFSNGCITNPQVSLGIISSGTGEGFAQSIGLKSNFRKTLLAIKQNQKVKYDLGKIQFRDGSVRYFLNEFQLGIGALVCNSVSPFLKRFGGRVAFGASSVKSFRSFKPIRINAEYSVPEREILNDLTTGIVIGNGSFTGGGMRLTPFAKTDDGYLDLLIMKKMSAYIMFSEFRKIYSAGHIYSENFLFRKIKEIRFKSDCLISEADGEVLTKCVDVVSVKPSVLNIFNKE